ncbi:hypothetical protein AQJ91_37860 [Streptomyces dysideae]|uniref:Uncharacterized protein n=1 Tax=Streptomyces dysideae TaxID=909626 RepID=A0A101USR2_9ACTN|nr:hypothetical protein AQJ91_37860 [Streptomyces dysideae]
MGDPAADGGVLAGAGCSGGLVVPDRAVDLRVPGGPDSGAGLRCSHVDDEGVGEVGGLFQVVAEAQDPVPLAQGEDPQLRERAY